MALPTGTPRAMARARSRNALRCATRRTCARFLASSALCAFLRLFRVRALPAACAGWVDDPAKPSCPADDRVARHAQRFCDLGGGPSGGLLRQQPFVARWRPARRHGCSRHSLRAASSTRAADDDHGVAQGNCLTPVTRINRKDQRDKLADVPVRPVTAGNRELGVKARAIRPGLVIAALTATRST